MLTAKAVLPITYLIFCINPSLPRIPYPRPSYPPPKSVSHSVWLQRKSKREGLFFVSRYPDKGAPSCLAMPPKGSFTLLYDIVLEDL